MNYYALIYDVVDDYITRRGEFRAEHLRLARESRGRGELFLAGAFSEPADQALLIFRSPDASTAENFAKNDPYVIHGLVKKWRVRPWMVVVGNE
ncbi:MAG: YciI family protein [Ignavibacteriales bacterium]|nr:YciI family protein [Ignavibacteriales bacterium]